jgi:hypothetical protein
MRTAVALVRRRSRGTSWWRRREGCRAVAAGQQVVVGPLSCGRQDHRLEVGELRHGVAPFVARTGTILFLLPPEPRRWGGPERVDRRAWLQAWGIASAR